MRPHPREELHVKHLEVQFPVPEGRGLLRGALPDERAREQRAAVAVQDSGVTRG